MDAASTRPTKRRRDESLSPRPVHAHHSHSQLPPSASSSSSAAVVTAPHHHQHHHHSHNNSSITASASQHSRSRSQSQSKSQSYSQPHSQTHSPTNHPHDHFESEARSPRSPSATAASYTLSGLRGSPSSSAPLAYDTHNPRSSYSAIAKPIAPGPSSSSSSSVSRYLDARSSHPHHSHHSHHHHAGKAYQTYSALGHHSTHSFSSSRHEEPYSARSPSAPSQYPSPSAYHAAIPSASQAAPLTAANSSTSSHSRQKSAAGGAAVSAPSPPCPSAASSRSHTPTRVAISTDTAQEERFQRSKAIGSSATHTAMGAPSSPRSPVASDVKMDEPEPKPSIKRELSTSAASTPGEKPRGGQACLECRLAKVRCLPSNDSESCQRCQRFSFECLFVQHKRGRKPKSKLQGRDLTLLAEAASATPASAVSTSSSAATGISARYQSQQQQSASASGSSGTPSSVRKSANSGQTQPSAASPGVRWSSGPDRAFAPTSDLQSQSHPSSLTNASGSGMEVDEGASNALSPSGAFSRRYPYSLQQQAMYPGQYGGRDAASGLDPRDMFGVDVARMTRAMQQAMRSLERRRGAPYTLVTNEATNNENGNNDDDDDDNSDGGPSPNAPTDINDTYAANESFELIAEQPLTLRVMLKPFEVAENPDCETPRVVQDDRITVGAHNQREIQMDDPITTGVLSEPAARALFEFFIVHCNAWSELFDQSLHTHDFVRKRSSFLYTVILYVASRYSKKPTAHHLLVRERRGERVEPSEWDIAYADPAGARDEAVADEYARQIRRQLHAQAREHAARAFVDGDRTVLCCQAFFVLASWKPLDDGLSVIQVGYAFRLAMDIQLHAEMPSCVKPNETLLDQAGKQRYEAVQRRFRNRQRTFLLLFVQDKSQQIANKITTHSISADNVLIRRCQTWWKLPGAIPGDTFVCASADLRRIHAKYVDLYDRIESLTSISSDGPSVMMPAFLNDLLEWNSRWHDAVGISEDLDDDMRLDDPHEYKRRCQRLCLKLFKDNLKTYVSSLVLKSSLKQAALQEHQEVIRNQHRRSTTRGTTEDRDSISGKTTGSSLHGQQLSSGLAPGTVNLMAMPAFWPCVEGARGVLEAVCAFPAERLLTAPDATIMQTTHAAVLLCSLATVRSQPALGPGYLRSTIQLIDQTSAAFRKASITEDDTAYHIALYLESLLRPKNAPPPPSAPSQQANSATCKLARGSKPGASASTTAATSANPTHRSDPRADAQSKTVPFKSTTGAGGSGNIDGDDGLDSSHLAYPGGVFGQSASDTDLAQHSTTGGGGGGGGGGGSGSHGNTHAAGLSTVANMFEHAAGAGYPSFGNGQSAMDFFYSGGSNGIATGGGAGAAGGGGAGMFWKQNQQQPGGGGGGQQFDADGLNAIAAAAAAAWPSSSASSTAWNQHPQPQQPQHQHNHNAASNGATASSSSQNPWPSYMFNFGQPTDSTLHQEQADETLQMLLRFLDG